MKKPDLEKTYGNPSIPAPTTVPVSVKVADQNLTLSFLNFILIVK